MASNSAGQNDTTCESLLIAPICVTKGFRSQMDKINVQKAYLLLSVKRVYLGGHILTEKIKLLVNLKNNTVFSLLIIPFTGWFSDWQVDIPKIWPHFTNDQSPYAQMQ